MVRLVRRVLIRVAFTGRRSSIAFIGTIIAQRFLYTLEISIRRFRSTTESRLSHARRSIRAISRMEQAIGCLLALPSSEQRAGPVSGLPRLERADPFHRRATAYSGRKQI